MAGVKVYLTSCETGEARRQEETLRRFWSLSDRRHELVDSPEAADLVIVGDLQGKGWFASLRTHPVVCRFPGKCIVLSESDNPMPLLQGVYTSARKSVKFGNRFRGGAYNLYDPDFKNPLIEGYVDKAFEKPKSWLYSFAGRDSHPVRVAILASQPRRQDVFLRHTTSFDAWSRDTAAKLRDNEEFRDVIEASKFALCPRGGGTASIRLFEAMKMGVAPIILSDDWIFPKGPRWEEFALVLPERDADKIEEVAERNESRYREMGAAAAEAYNRYFSDASYFNYLVDQFTDIRATRRIPESVFWFFRNMMVRYWQFQRDLADLRWKIRHFMEREAPHESPSGQEV